MEEQGNLQQSRCTRDIKIFITNKHDKMIKRQVQVVSKYLLQTNRHENNDQLTNLQSQEVF